MRQLGSVYLPQDPVVTLSDIAGFSAPQFSHLQNEITEGPSLRVAGNSVVKLESCSCLPTRWLGRCGVQERSRVCCGWLCVSLQQLPSSRLLA